MLTRSAKNKGTALQRWFVQHILKRFKSLTKDDVRSIPPSLNEADVWLSSEAQKLIPFEIECKNHKKIAVYKFYEQATGHGGKEPLVVIKANYKKPLVIVDAEFFLDTWQELMEKRKMSLKDEMLIFNEGDLVYVFDVEETGEILSRPMTDDEVYFLIKLDTGEFVSKKLGDFGYVE